jgi:hypothetical protein
MATMRSLAAKVRETGCVQLIGEMECPANEGVLVAVQVAMRAASQCGYNVFNQWNSGFDVCGGDITGFYRFDWGSKDNLRVKSIEHYTAKIVRFK